MVDINRREFLKRAIGLSVTALGASQLEVLADDAKVKFDRKDAEERLRVREKKGYTFLQNPVGYTLIRTPNIETMIYGINLSDNACIPTWTNGAEVRQNIDFYLDRAEEIYDNLDKLESLEEVFDRESKENFLKNTHNIFYWRAMKSAIEEYKDRKDRLEKLARDMMDLHELHEMPSLAIQQGKAPRELARYRIPDDMYAKAVKTGFDGFYNENYTQQKIAALLHQGSLSKTKINSQDDAVALAISWIMNKDEKERDNYSKAGRFVLERIAEKTGKDSINAGIAEFARLDIDKKRDIFRNMSIEIYGTGF